MYKTWPDLFGLLGKYESEAEIFDEFCNSKDYDICIMVNTGFRLMHTLLILNNLVHSLAKSVHGILYHNSVNVTRS
jgi:hypothetical protein